MISAPRVLFACSSPSADTLRPRISRGAARIAATTVQSIVRRLLSSSLDVSMRFVLFQREPGVGAEREEMDVEKLRSSLRWRLKTVVAWREGPKNG
jgi:hypothetical protein